MSQTTTALFVKFFMTFIAEVIPLYFINGNPIGWIVVLAIVGTALNYLVGDLLVFPAFGNIAASISDGIMISVVAYVFDLLSQMFYTSLTSLIILTVLVAVG